MTDIVDAEGRARRNYSNNKYLCERKSENIKELSFRDS